MTETDRIEYTDQELRDFFRQFAENLPSEVSALLRDESVPMASVVDRLHEAAVRNARVGRAWADVLNRFPHREPLAFALRRKRSLRVIPNLGVA